MYYEKHIFICDNQRAPDERKSCGAKGTEVLRYLKPRFKEAYSGSGKIRVQRSGCMDRCEEGPILVSYPEGTWFSLNSIEDANLFLESYIRDNDISAIQDLIIPGN